MKCIYCGHTESKVIDSRTSNDNMSIRRRRECLNCKKRFTTYESMESSPILVIKKNGGVQPFDRNKIINSIMKACSKRPVGLDEIEEIAMNAEKEFLDNFDGEISSKQIGEFVMKSLKNIDEMSYIRYACVFMDFDTLQEFYNFVNC